MNNFVDSGAHGQKLGSAERKWLRGRGIKVSFRDARSGVSRSLEESELGYKYAHPFLLGVEANRRLRFQKEIAWCELCERQGLWEGSQQRGTSEGKRDRRGGHGP